MHKNPYWLIFLLIIGLAVIGYTGFTLYKVYQYNRIDYQMATFAMEWSIKRLDVDDVALVANYQYTWNKTNYAGKAEYANHFLNDWAAQEALLKRKQEKW